MSPMSSRNGTSIATQFTEFLEDKFIDEEIIEKYLAYDPDKQNEIDARALIEIVKSILCVTTRTIEGEEAWSPECNYDFKSNPSSSDISLPSSTERLIRQISRQMECQCDKDPKEVTQSIFHTVSCYSWPNQIALVLTAFARYYGDFCSINEAVSEYNGTSLNGLSALKKPLILAKKVGMVSLNTLTRKVFILASELVCLSNLLKDYPQSLRDAPALHAAFVKIPSWSCKTIVFIAFATVYFTTLIDSEDSDSSSSVPGRSNRQSLDPDVTKVINEVDRAIHDCREQIDEKKKYDELAHRIACPMDIVDVLSALVDMGKDYPYDPLVCGPNDIPVPFKKFRKKNVLLVISCYISNFKLSPYDIQALKSVEDDSSFHTERPKKPKSQQETKEKLHEIVWIPIEDSVEENMEVPTELKSWHRVKQPRLVNRLAIKYIKEEWYFRREPIVVVLNPLGRVVNINALPNMRIWGPAAFPYTESCFHLWKEPNNWFKLVIEPVLHPKTSDWKDNYQIFYGGEAIGDLPADVKAIPESTISFFHIDGEKLKLFLTLLKSCLVSRAQWVQLQRSWPDILEEPTLNEICKAYTAYRVSGFAILTKGVTLVHVGFYHEAWTALTEVQKLIKTAVADSSQTPDFGEVYKRQYDMLPAPSCTHWDLPDLVGQKPEDMRCPRSNPKCSRYMSYDIGYKCCHDEI